MSKFDEHYNICIRVLLNMRRYALHAYMQIKQNTTVAHVYIIQ